MSESLLGLALQFSYLFNHITISNLIDMILVAVIFFLAFQALNQTRALQLLRGVIVAATLGGGLLVLLPLNTLNWLVRLGLIAGVIALPILFQDELRRALVNLGQIGQHKGTIPNFERFKGSIVSAATQLSKRQVGALIVLEGQALLEDVVDTGIRLGAEVLSSELIQTIFSPKTPLHDGAVILRGDRLVAASCILPIQTDNLGDSQLGTRHRAALGLSSKVSDALVIIVSEETGWISVAFAGRLYLDLSPGELEEWIDRFGAQLEKTVSKRRGWFSDGSLRPTLINLMISILLAVIAWIIVIYQTNPPAQTVLQGVPLIVMALPDDLIMMDDLPMSVNVQVQTTNDRVGNLSETGTQAVLDLSNLTPGVHSVPVKVTIADPLVQLLSIKPDSVDVTLEQMLSKLITPTVTINDLTALPPGYVVDDVSLSPSSVTVSGPESKVAQVAAARMQISIGDRRAVFQEFATPVFIDRNGKLVAGVTADPDQMVVTIPVRKTFFTREIGIQSQVDESGLNPNYEVTGVEVIPSTISIAGTQSALEQVDGYLSTATILLGNQTSDFVTDAPLIVPDDLSVLDENGTPIRSVEVRVAIKPINGYLVLQRDVVIVNPVEISSVKIAPAKVSVLLIGPQFLLSEIQNNPDLVVISVQIGEQMPGLYPMQLQVRAPGGLQVQVFPNEIQVTID